MPDPVAASAPLGAAVTAAAAALARGEIVAYPTETFYGLAVDAANPAALAALVALKGRGVEKAFSLLVTPAMLPALVTRVPAAAVRLMAALWPGPLTLALPARDDLPEHLALDGCVAVRESPEPTARALVAAFGRPITATSANPAGAAAARTAAEVRAHFPTGCHVLDGGATPGGQPSTLVRVRPGAPFEVLRPGVIPRDALDAVSG